MDPTNSENGQPGVPQTGLDRKKILLLAGVGIAVFILMIFIVVTSITNNEQETETKAGEQNVTKNSSLLPSVLPTSQASAMPEAAAMSFYNWYVNHPDPIKSREYQKRDDLTADFKIVMGRFVDKGIDPGYDHVFCALTTIPKEVRVSDVLYERENLASVMLAEATPDGINLFQIKLQKDGEKWMVNDVWCPPAN